MIVKEAAATGSTLKYWRKAAGLTQRQLGGLVGADFTYLSKIENGRDTGGRALVERIDAATGADGRLIEAWKASRCAACGARLSK